MRNPSAKRFDAKTVRYGKEPHPWVEMEVYTLGAEYDRDWRWANPIPGSKHWHRRKAEQEGGGQGERVNSVQPKKEKDTKKQQLQVARYILREMTHPNLQQEYRYKTVTRRGAQEQTSNHRSCAPARSR